MLNQINHWMEYVAAGVDLVLLLRILSLRLQRTYLFVTLLCTLSVLFDAANFRFAQDVPRVQFYSQIFLACLFPVACWDIFEEVAALVGGLRRLAMLRTLASLILISFIGLIWLSSQADADDPSGLAYPWALSIIVSTASAAGCLGFLWIMHRGIQIHKVAIRKNTFVWMIFFSLSMAGQLASSFAEMTAQSFDSQMREKFWTIAVLVLNSFSTLISLWCVVKLRGLPKDLSAPISETETRP